ncbi:MAG: thaumatin family protein [Fibrobacterales bacterium]
MIAQVSILLLMSVFFLGCSNTPTVEEVIGGSSDDVIDESSNVSSSSEALSHSGTVSSVSIGQSSNLIESSDAVDMSSSTNTIISSEEQEVLSSSSSSIENVSSVNEWEDTSFDEIIAVDGSVTFREYELGGIEVSFPVPSGESNVLVRYKTRLKDASDFVVHRFDLNPTTQSGTEWTVKLDHPSKNFFMGEEDVRVWIEIGGSILPVGAVHDDMSTWFEYTTAYQRSKTEVPWDVVDDQPNRLRITNNCNEDLWIEMGAQPDHIALLESRGVDLNKYLEAGTSYDYNIPEDRQINGTRYWPKQGCDDTGRNCEIGGSSTCGGSLGDACTPPIESKFEITWEAVDNESVEMYYNASNVDGYTLPYVVIPKGDKVDEWSKCVVVNGSRLDVDKCPEHESLDQDGYRDFDLSYRNSDGERIGCYSPCKYLTFEDGLDEWNDPIALRSCCPTHMDGNNLIAGVSSEQCNERDHQFSIWKTQYVDVSHEMAPKIYTFAYDDAGSLYTCHPSTKFEIIFCPKAYDFEQTAW